MKKYLGIDVGGTYIKYGVYTKDCTQIVSNKIETKRDTLENFIECVANIIEEHSYVDGIGLSLPGFINIHTGLVMEAGAIKPLKGENIKELILKRCNREIEAENDVNCVALAEKWKGNGVDYENFITITFGTGVGGGIIINNKLYRGSKFMAGEFGYMVVDGKCSDSYFMSNSSAVASTFSLVRDVANKKSIPKRDLTGEEIFEMLLSNDEEVLEIYEKWIERVSLTIYNLIYTLNPDAVLIGGGVSEQNKVLEDIKEKLEEIEPGTSTVTDINTCKFKNDSGKIGAIYHYLYENDIH